MAMTTSDSPEPVTRRLLLAWAFIATVWIGGFAWPKALLMLGIADYGKVGLDSYVLLAAADAVRAGLDPHAANPLDILHRPHVYSDWWLGLRWLGLTREHNTLMGLAWIAAFALAAAVTFRPRGRWQTLALVGFMVSPPVLLAVNRANNDLVIFVVLAGCGLAAVPTLWRVGVAVGCFALATGLKYFPAPAVLSLLWVRPVRRAPAGLLAGIVVVAIALFSVWDQMHRSRFLINSGIYTMGAPLWWRDRGLADQASALPSLALIAGAALILAWTRVTTGLATRGRPAERLLAALGALVVLTCFLAGVNYAYRWIFLLWPAGWLWRLAGEAALARRERLAAQFAGGLALACLWLDSLLCLSVNLYLTQQGLVWKQQFDVLWRNWTQPLTWALMMLLAGWLLEGALATAREWWALRHER
jgi:hypothetical protein